MTTIRYFIPEDGDTESHPNVFLAPKPARPGVPPKLGDIRGAFPLPGRYHFRFKSPLIPGGDREKGGLAVWMDCVDDEQPVGVWRNAIVAKVTRIGIEDDDEDEEFERHHHAAAAAPVPAPQATAPPPPPAPAPASAPGPRLDIFDAPSSAPSSNPSSLPGSTHSSTGDLLGADPEPAPPAPPAPAAAAAAHHHGGESLLDFGGGHTTPGHTASATSVHSDFMGMTAHPPAAAPVPAAPQTAPAPVQGFSPQHQAHARAQTHPQAHPQQRQPPPPQQQQPARPPPQRTASGGNAFDQFGAQKNPGPFGDLQWS